MASYGDILALQADGWLASRGLLRIWRLLVIREPPSDPETSDDPAYIRWTAGVRSFLSPTYDTFRSWSQESAWRSDWRDIHRARGIFHAVLQTPGGPVELNSLRAEQERGTLRSSGLHGASKPDNFDKEAIRQEERQAPKKSWSAQTQQRAWRCGRGGSGQGLRRRVLGYTTCAGG